MIVPFKIHYPVLLATSGSNIVLLESILPFGNALDVCMLIYNVSAVNITFNLQFTLNLGLTGDPLDSGVYTTYVKGTNLSPITVNAGTTNMTVLPDLTVKSIGDSNTAPVQTFHTLTLTNTSSISTAIVQTLLTGYIEQFPTVTQLPLNR